MMNRGKLIERFIGNISNSIVYQILEKAINQEEISGRYNKELLTSFNIAMKYREKINPVNSQLPKKDVLVIRKKIINKVRAEINLRISRGYENIDLNLIEKLTDKTLKNARIK